MSLEKKQELTVVKKAEFGVYLAEGPEASERGAASEEAGAGGDGHRRQA